MILIDLLEGRELGKRVVPIRGTARCAFVRFVLAPGPKPAMRISGILLQSAATTAFALGHGEVTKAHVLANLALPYFALTHLFETHSMERYRQSLLAPLPKVTGPRAPLAVEPDLVRAIESAPLVPRVKRESVVPGEPIAEDVFEAWNQGVDFTPFAWDHRPIERLYSASMQYIAEGQPVPFVEQTLIALAAGEGDDGRFAEALRRIGHDPAFVESAFRSMLDRLEGEGDSIGTLARWVWRATRHAMFTKQTRALDIDFLVALTLGRPTAQQMLAAAGISRDALAYSYAYGLTSIEPPERGREVVFHRDYVETDVMSAMLKKHFGRSETVASALSQELLGHGGTLVIPAWRGAADAIRAAHADCLAQAQPLWIELRA